LGAQRGRPAGDGSRSVRLGTGLVRAELGHQLVHRCGYLVAKRVKVTRRRVAGQAPVCEHAECVQIAPDCCRPCGARTAEPEELRSAVAPEHDLFWPDVAMREAGLVQNVQRRGNPGDDIDSPAWTERSAVQQPGEWLAVDVFHNQERALRDR
jgi:hypothetical protein